MPTYNSYASTSAVKLSNDYGVAFKPGFLLSPTTLLYGKIGAIWANLKVSTTFSANNQVALFNLAEPFIYNASAQISGSSEEEENKVALLLGVGVEQFIYRDRITVNVEYNYANYGSVTTSAPLTGQGSGSLDVDDSIISLDGLLSGAVAQATANVKVSTLLAGLNFYFGSQWF